MPDVLWIQLSFISIHAPARGASGSPGKDGTPGKISIHAPARGASMIPLSADLLPVDFNSRPCERGFRQPHDRPEREEYFNSRPCERGFMETGKGNMFSELFQFTPLREGLRQNGHEEQVSIRFQFTPLREGLHSPDFTIKSE